MKKIALTFAVITCVPFLMQACGKTSGSPEVSNANPSPKTDMLLGDADNIDDKKLAEAKHINIAIDKTGLVIFQGIPGPDGKVTDHRLSQKDSREILEEIKKANKGGGKEHLTELIQAHVTRIQTGK